MNIYKQEQHETLLWWLAGLATSFCAWIIVLGLVISCHPKAKPTPAPEPVTIILADTNRVKLVHRAQASADTLTIAHKRSQQSVTNYENAVSTYDSIRVTLP